MTANTPEARSWPSRPRALDAPQLLDGLPELAFARLAAKALKAPAAVLWLADGSHQAFDRRVGLRASGRPMPIPRAFCRHVAEEGRPLVVEDARGRPLAGEPNIAAYLGVPVATPAGDTRGALCVTDATPRRWDPDDVEVLEGLAAAAATELRLRSEVAGRGHAEVASREYLERYRVLTEVSPQFVWFSTSEGVVTDCNRLWHDYTGLTPEQTAGDGWAVAVHPEDRDRVFDAWRRSLREGREYEADFRLRRARDGAYRWHLARALPVRDESGRVARWMGTSIDIHDRKCAEQEIRDLNRRLEQRLGRIDALRQIDRAITASLDLGFTLEVFLDQVVAQLRVDAADVLLCDPHARGLEFAAARGFRTPAMLRARPPLAASVPGRVVAGRRPVRIDDLARPPADFARAELAAEEGFAAYCGVPLLVKGRVRGVLEVFLRSPLPDDPEWHDFLAALAGQAAIAVDNASLFEGLQRANAELISAYDATIEGWSRALDLRDKETEGHTRRVTEMTLRLAEAMGLSGPGLVHIRRGALLHDIGKLGVPDAILLKPGPLADEEWAVMRRHPALALEMLSAVDFLRPALDIPYCHHEKWDGTGYPRGLEGEQIPLAARIFAAADIWDALRSDRPYRDGWPEERALEYIRSLSGTHLDPAVVEAFVAMMAGDRPDSPGAEGRPGRAPRRCHLGLPAHLLADAGRPAGDSPQFMACPLPCEEMAR